LTARSGLSASTAPSTRPRAPRLRRSRANRGAPPRRAALGAPGGAGHRPARVHPHHLRRGRRGAERAPGQPAGLTTEERQRLKDLERENRELKRANEILRKASAFFAQAELDRRPKLRKRHSRGEHRRQIELTIMNDEPCCDRVRN